ncbi:MAG: hypothetical protein ACRDOH_33710, partial [Streptosporangiaceae bacterium]
MRPRGPALRRDGGGGSTSRCGLEPARMICSSSRRRLTASFTGQRGRYPRYQPAARRGPGTVIAAGGPHGRHASAAQAADRPDRGAAGHHASLTCPARHEAAIGWRGSPGYLTARAGNATMTTSRSRVAASHQGAACAGEQRR